MLKSIIDWFSTVSIFFLIILYVFILTLFIGVFWFLIDLLPIKIIKWNYIKKKLTG